MKSFKHPYIKDWWGGYIFSLRGIRRNYGVVPILAVMAFKITGVMLTTCYALYTKDYQFDRSHKRMVHQTMDLHRPYPLKLLTYNQEYKPMDDLADLLKEIDDAEEEERANPSEKKGKKGKK